MAGQLKSGSIVAPGFNGLNSQDSGITLDSGWALTANNCVIDRYGRIGARKGWVMVTTDPDTLTASATVDAIFEYKDVDGTYEYLIAGDNKLFTSADCDTFAVQTVKKADNSGAYTYSITGDNWQFASLPYGAGASAVGNAFAAQLGHPLLVYNNYSGNDIFRVVGDSFGGVTVGYVPTGFSAGSFDPNVVVSGYGRLWCANTTQNKTTVFYSVLLDGTDFSSAGSGVLDISAVVGNNDEIVGISLHNNFLTVFCKNNTVVYSSADDPTNIALADVIKGVGCIARDSIQNTGTDVIFMSKSGIRSLGRTIQEKSMPMRELSMNIRDEFVEWTMGEDTDAIKSIYFEREAFYLVTFPTLKQIVCFDMRTVLENGAVKVTLWDDIEHKAFCVTEGRELLVGQVDGVGKYYGYTDNNVSYRLAYYTNYFDLGSATQLKMLKKIGVIVIGGQGQSFVVKFGFDYSTNFRSRPLTLSTLGDISEYNIGEYDIAEYSGGTLAQNITVNAGGAGKVIQLGFEADINGDPLSVQKIDVAVLAGKTII